MTDTVQSVLYIANYSAIGGQVNISPAAMTAGGMSSFRPGNTPFLLTGGLGVIYDPVTTNAYTAPVTSDAADAQAVSPNSTLEVNMARLQGFNGATFDRLKTLSDNADNDTNKTSGLIGSVARQQLYDDGSSTWIRQRGGFDNIDSQAPLSLAGSSRSISRGTLYNGSSWDRKRTSNVFKSVTATAAGNTAVWTPAAGKKFRLMKVYLKVTSNSTLAAAGILLAQLFDGAAGVIGVADNVFIPGSGNQVHQDYQFDLGNGYLSAAANNVLNINLSAALTAGVVSITVSGTEE